MKENNYPFTYLLEYIPQRFAEINDWEKTERYIIFDFKSGIYTTSLMRKIQKKIIDITKGNYESWCMAFIPAATESATKKRYGRLVDFLKDNIPMDISLDAVQFVGDYSSRHGKEKEKVFSESYTYSVSLNFVFNRNVILFDDIITSGKTYQQIACCVMSAKAISVQGLMLAKTVYPKD